MLTFEFSLNCCCWLVNEYYQVTKTSVGYWAKELSTSGPLLYPFSHTNFCENGKQSTTSTTQLPPPSRHQTWDTLAPAMTPPLVISGGHHWRPVQTCSLQDTSLPVMTSGGWSTYGVQAGSTHPTGMLSSLYLKLPFNYQLNLEIHVLTEIKVTVIWQW